MIGASYSPFTPSYAGSKRSTETCGGSGQTTYVVQRLKELRALPDAYPIVKPRTQVCSEDVVAAGYLSLLFTVLYQRQLHFGTCAGAARPHDWSTAFYHP
jgi:hypothetical protein